MVQKNAQIAKAKAFHQLHEDPKLLILPNIWDTIGARLLQYLGFPAVATASAAVAYSKGYDDGQQISFGEALEVIREIAGAVDVPMTADIERGYADAPDSVAANIRDVMHAGAVGINIEDSIVEGGDLREIDDQSARLRAVREMADGEGIPLFINARIDVFLRDGPESRAARIEETITRARAYIDAGADGIYPITAGDLETLAPIRSAIDAPINVYANKDAASIRELESAGINRLSLGPGLIKASLTAMRDVAEGLKRGESYDSFTRDVISNEEILGINSRGKT
jgi:2-methylisocitrate lyase-like PEP mutase family enzyme